MDVAVSPTFQPVVGSGVHATEPVPKRKAQGKGNGHEVWVDGRWMREDVARAAGLLDRPMPTPGPWPITRPAA